MVEFDYFRDMKDVTTYKAGDIIFSAGDPDNILYGVQEGEVDLMFNGELLETVQKSGIFGEKSLIDESPHTTSAIAKTDCKIVKLDESKFLFLVHETPTFALHVMRTMTTRTRTVMTMAMK